MVSDSVLKKFGIKKSIGFSIVKIWYQKKISDSVSKNLVLQEDSDSFSFRFWVSWMTFRFPKFSVSKLFYFFNGFGFGIEKIWYR